MLPSIIKVEVKKYWEQEKLKKKFVPGETPIPVSGKVFDEEELLSGIEAVMDGWWTEGRFALEFEREFSKFLGIRYVSLVNSGSSANLVALTSLTSKVFGEKSLKPGDEVITCATGFPTTVNPIIMNNLIPVFVDADIGTKNPTVDGIMRAITPKTKAIMLAHTLGNPLPLAGILDLVKKHNLWFIEDCCDALGSEYLQKKCGTFGHIATFSFYPAHQITMGEGGAAVTDNPLIHRAIRQFRDWGRDCWCDTGKDNTCGKRFRWKLGDLPEGYDHKYIYSQIGYNLKLTDMQAAIGLSQLKKLPAFINKRKNNFSLLYEVYRKYEKYFILPKFEKESDPCWFGFPVVVRDDAPFSSRKLIEYLENANIGTRTIFAGNILRHPGYMYRTDLIVPHDMTGSDILMKQGFWIGVFPGITTEMISFVQSTLQAFIKSKF